ncbi:MAG: hypothetical protein ABJA37_13030 [Ferruginibacter sp.]
MKKQIYVLLVFLVTGGMVSAQSNQTDFVPGYNVIFEDHFEMDPVGDLPAKWSTSGDGQLVEFSKPKGKWFKISSPTAVNPELDAPLPENSTIEFDLLMKRTSGVAPIVMFGLTTLSDVSSSDVYRSNIFVKIMGYNDGSNAEIVYGKNIQDMGTKKTFPISSYIDRPLHVSIAINGSRFRVYFANQKVVDLPKLLTPEYLGNFFVASAEVTPASEESVYISNMRIASGDVDARSLLIKQLLEQGSVVTNTINFNPQSNEVTTESTPLLDTLGQTMVADPNLAIQINGMEQPETSTGQPANSNGVMNEKARLKVEKIKAYLVNKFNVNVDRIVTGVSSKIKSTAEQVKNSKTGLKVKGFLTEIIKL